VKLVSCVISNIHIFAKRFSVLCHLVKWISLRIKKNTQVAIIYTPDYIWVVFRGSEWWPKSGTSKGSYMKSISDDWTVDFDTQLAQESNKEGVCVHRDFQTALNDVWADLEKGIEYAKQGNQNKPIFFTGHSVGGAIATLAGLRFGDRVQSVYTFGAPAVGNAAYVNEYTERGPLLINVVNNDDVFPSLLMPQLAHPGLYVHLTKDGNLRLNESPRSYSPKGIGKSKSLLDRLVVDYAVLDHSPVMYSVQLWNQFAH